MEHEITSFTKFTFADYGVIGFLLISIFISLFRGFVRECLSLVTWILAVIIALKFHSQLNFVLEPYISTPSLRVFASFGILFIITLILGGLVSFLFTRLIVCTGLTGTDRCLGVLFGIARGVLLVSVVIILLTFTSFTEDEWYQHSILIPKFNPIIDWLKTFLPQALKHVTEVVHNI